MGKNRFQISIRDLMLAMFWVGVCVAAWGGAARNGWQDPSVRLADPYRAYQTLALATLGWSSMFAAIWSLVGRAKKGILIGIGMWLLLLVLSLLLLV
jgi:hypothetical protein